MAEIPLVASGLVFRYRSSRIFFFSVASMIATRNLTAAVTVKTEAMAWGVFDP
jgi:hypothetical protein